MLVLQHDSQAGFEREYQQVRAALILRGTSMSAWLDARGINRQLAWNALTGRSHGKKAREVRAAILREVLAPAEAA